MDENKSQDPGGTREMEIRYDGLVWRMPQRTDSGYLKRTKTALGLKQEFEELGEDLEGDDLSPEALDALIKFLSVYVVDPAGSTEQKVQALEEWVSEEDLENMLTWTGIIGGEEEGSEDLDPTAYPPVDLAPGSSWS